MEIALQKGKVVPLGALGDSDHLEHPFLVKIDKKCVRSIIKFMEEFNKKIKIIKKVSL